MLALFPEILFLSTFAPLVLRISLVVILVVSAWDHAARPSLVARGWGLIEVAAAAALLAGAWTQPVALVAALWLIASLFVRDIRIFPRSTVALAIVIAISLVVTGPGAFAFDLPL